MGPFAIVGATVAPFTVRLRRPFVTASGAKTATTNVGVRLLLAGGAEGYGEASTSVAHRAHTAPRLAAALRRLARRLRGRDARALQPLAAEIWREAGDLPAAAAAFEVALTEAALAALGVPLEAWLGGSSRRIETDLTLSAVPPEQAAQAAAEAAARGFRRLKVKVAGDPAADLARVLAADRSGRRRGRRPEIILDGNQALRPAAALRLVERCLSAGVRVRLLEQPVAADDLAGLAEVRRRSPVPVAADESCRSAADALRLADRDAADVFNVKLAKRGLSGSRAIMAVAAAAGKGLMIGCMQESAAGLAASLALACGTGAFGFVDLDSDCLLADGQPRGRVRREGPFLSLD